MSTFFVRPPLGGDSHIFPSPIQKNRDSGDNGIIPNKSTTYKLEIGIVKSLAGLKKGYSLFNCKSLDKTPPRDSITKIRNYSGIDFIRACNYSGIDFTKTTKICNTTHNARRINFTKIAKIRNTIGVDFTKISPRVIRGCEKSKQWFEKSKT